ncbi:hypothetical protein MEQ_01247 [Candida albicans P87]|nr:hypothetical protein MG1_01264 [Candida albicans GC75]KGU13526.1 hypothetical protein MEQ_01247 [Candida albicans P87]KGU34648.1 hypothetical protein MGM_01306 [Candida albicans P75063]KHC74581.1 hypothetical protein MGI_01251 [Candida albicans P75016]
MKGVKKIKKLYNYYAIGLIILLFSFVSGMELYSYLSVRQTSLFATLYREPTKFDINLLKSTNYLGAIGNY